jgi:ribosome biogenesis GTP-binding protein YsxC/EngB
MKIDAAFVTSAASASDFPRGELPEIAMVGRSNVGKSSVINALVRQRLARTSAAPGKTRLANVYRVARGGAPPLYLVDLPGYGYARGGADAADEFEALTRAYFARSHASGLLLVDARHPGLASDRAAWQWIHAAVPGVGLVATKIDKLARGERIRAVRQLESVFEHPVLPVSAVTGEGLDQLWRTIDRLANNPAEPAPRPRLPRRPERRPPRR